MAFVPTTIFAASGVDTIPMNEERPKCEVIAAAKISVQPDKRKELLMTLNSLLDRIRKEDGCCSYRFFGEDTDDDSFMLISEWETRSDWERHLFSEDFAILKGSIGVLGNGGNHSFQVLTHIAANET
jgi:quinol monooxygenase YgiN